MLWIYLVIIAQLLYAVVTLLDKYFVTSRAISVPVVYTFYVGMLSAVVVLLLPFGVILLPSAGIVWLYLATGFSYIFSLLFLYKALKVSDASDVAPALGAIVAISTFFFSFLILKSGITSNFLFGFIFLVTGTALMSYFRFNKKSFLYTIAAGILFGLSFVFIKKVFLETSFINGFFWSRMANVLAAMTLLLWPANLKAISHNFKKSSRGTKYLVVGNKTIAGVAFLLILIAINLGNVSIINALSGIQFMFLLLFAVIFTKKFPKYLYETVHRKHIVMHKVFATALIIAGLVFLFL